MVTSDKTGDEDTEGAINELADDLLKGDSESVTDALESVRAKDAQEELDRLLRDADNNPLYTQKTLDGWVSDAEKKSKAQTSDPWADLR